MKTLGNDTEQELTSLSLKFLVCQGRGRDNNAHLAELV